MSEINLSVRFFGEESVPAGSSWHGLIDNLIGRGVRLHETGDDVPATHLLVIDYRAADENNWPNVPNSNRFLIATECETVNPLQFSRHVSKKFAQVLVPSRLYPQRANTRVWEGGYFNALSLGRPHSNDGSRRDCGLINENKFSFVPQSNYLLRSKFILSAGDAGISLTVAGQNWRRNWLWTLAKLLHHWVIAFRAGYLSLRITDSLYAIYFSLHRKTVGRSTVGRVPDAVAFLSNFKVAIVIENESSYVSEKLYQALFAGAQCVYVGPKLDPAEFPEGFLFQAEPNIKSVIENTRLALRTSYSVRASEINGLVEEGAHFLREAVSNRNLWLSRRILEWLQPPS